jgi:hypothetical protein
MRMFARMHADDDKLVRKFFFQDLQFCQDIQAVHTAVGEKIKQNDLSQKVLLAQGYMVQPSGILHAERTNCLSHFSMSFCIASEHIVRPKAPVTPTKLPLTLVRAGSLEKMTGYFLLKRRFLSS